MYNLIVLLELLREVRLLASLEDENIARVLAVSTAFIRDPYLSGLTQFKKKLPC